MNDTEQYHSERVETTTSRAFSLDTGNLRPEIVRSWQCCRNPSVLPDSRFSPSLYVEMQLLGTVVLHFTTSYR